MFGFDKLSEGTRMMIVGALGAAAGVGICYMYYNRKSIREGYSHTAGLGSGTGGIAFDHGENQYSQEETYSSPKDVEYMMPPAVDGDFGTPGVREGYDHNVVNNPQVTLAGQPSMCGADRVMTSDDIATAHAVNTANAVHYNVTPALVQGAIGVGKYGKYNSVSHGGKFVHNLDLAHKISKNQHDLPLVGSTTTGHTNHYFHGLTGSGVHSAHMLGAHKSMNPSLIPAGRGAHSIHL